jgi:integrase
VAKRLTTVAVKNLRPGRKRREISDGGCPGLHLIIQPTGRKSWALRIRRPNGQSAKVTLGSCDVSGAEIAGEPVVGGHLTLAAARRLATDLHRQRAMGKDIAADAVAAKRRKKHAREALAAATFGRAVVDYVDYAKTRQRSWVAVGRMLGIDEDLKVIAGGLADRWRDKPVSEIDGHDIHAIVEDRRHRGIPGRGRRAAGATAALACVFHARLSSLFTWLRTKRRIETNPVAGVAAPDGPKARDRVLSDLEVIALWRATDEVGEPFGSIFKLLLLTGCRLNEIAGMQWNELSTDGATLHLPAERVKNKRPHDVALSPLARDIIASATRIDGASFVFTVTGRSPVNGFSRVKGRLDAITGIDEPWRTHDIRRTVASGLQRLGVPLPVTEKILNHVSGSFSGIVGIYQRHEYAAEQRVALERWADHITGLVEGRGATVVPIRGRGQ